MQTTSLALVPILLTLCACANTPATRPGDPATIPVFRSDDPRVGTAGFVQNTLRLHREVDGVRYTLMAFAVGDTLTLGAMVRGAFRGEVRLRLGARTLSFRFDAQQPPKDVAIAVDGAVAAELVGHGASFRGTGWVNIDLPRDAWLHDGDALRLQFASDSAGNIDLPDADQHFVTHFESSKS